MSNDSNSYSHSHHKSVIRTQNNTLRIAISGQSGCGNTTIGTLLAEKLQLSFINYTLRNLAEDENIDFKELYELALQDDKYDKIVDGKQLELARKQSCVLSSRLAIWFLEEANLKVYLYANTDTRIARIFQREGGSLDDIHKFTQKRDQNDIARYRKLYDIDTTCYKFAHLAINTEFYTPDQIVNIIINALYR